MSKEKTVFKRDEINRLSKDNKGASKSKATPNKDGKWVTINGAHRFIEGKKK